LHLQTSTQKQNGQGFDVNVVFKLKKTWMNQITDLFRAAWASAMVDHPHTFNNMFWAHHRPLFEVWKEVYYNQEHVPPSCNWPTESFSYKIGKCFGWVSKMGSFFQILHNLASIEVIFHFLFENKSGFWIIKAIDLSVYLHM
jgi:hypothetical protein